MERQGIPPIPPENAKEHERQKQAVCAGSQPSSTSSGQDELVPKKTKSEGSSVPADCPKRPQMKQTAARAGCIARRPPPQIDRMKLMCQACSHTGIHRQSCMVFVDNWPAPSPGLSQPWKAPPAPDSAPHIHRLPDKLLEKIFCYLYQEDVIERVLPVCKRWQRIAQNLVLSKKLEFTYNNISLVEALRLIRVIPNLQCLEMTVRTDAEELLYAAAHQCKELRSLLVNCCKCKRDNLTAALCTVVRSCKQLTEIQIASIPLRGLRFFRELGLALPNLRKLTVQCSWFGPPELDIVLNSCREVLSFQAACSNFFDEDIAKLAQHWGCSLQVLQLYTAHFTDAGLEHLASFPELQVLKLSGLMTAGSWLLKLADLSQLDYLDFSWSFDVVATKLRQFFLQSRSVGQLRKLKFAHCNKVDGSVLSALAANCLCLEDLVLYRCHRVTNARFRELLRGCSWLARLRLETHGSIVHVLPELPQRAPQMQWLTISFPSPLFSIETTIMKLQMEMPGLFCECVYS